MGADLCGFFAFVPEATYAALLKQQLDDIDFILLAKMVRPAKDVKALSELGVVVEEWTDNQGLSAEDTLAAIADEVKLARAFKLPAGWRDMAGQNILVNGVSVAVLFAGEMTWGDEPSGGGYAELQALYRLGVLPKFETAIPWGTGRPPRTAGNKKR